eukprot:389330-Pleurochrysis_carterae.AAC.6
MIGAAYGALGEDLAPRTHSATPWLESEEFVNNFGEWIASGGDGSSAYLAALALVRFDGIASFGVFGIVKTIALPAKPIAVAAARVSFISC